MGKQEAFDKVVEFVQTETKSKNFRLDYPVSEDLRKVMVDEVFQDFMIFALDCFYDEYLPMLKEYVDEHVPGKEKRNSLIQNLFWWRLLYDSSQGFGSSCVEDYIAENYQRLCKRPILISWLRECAKAVPNFYFIGHKSNDRYFVAVDILKEKTLEVMVLDPAANPPKKGEIAMGTLIPLGDGLFFPIVDFYHFDFEAREAMASCFHHHYGKYLKNSTMHEAFIHVLSVMLQIERIIFMKNKENHSTK